MTTYARNWKINEAMELRYPCYCADCQDLTHAEPGEALARAGNIWEVLFSCPDHGPLYPWELVDIPEGYTVVDGYIEKVDDRN